MNQRNIEHIALYSLVLVGTLVIGVLARQFVLSKGVDDFSSSVTFFATVIVLMAIYASLQTTFNQFLLPRMYNPQIQISEKSQTKRIEIADSRKTKRPKIDKRTTHNKRHSNAIITL